MSLKYEDYENDELTTIFRDLAVNENLDVKLLFNKYKKTQKLNQKKHISKSDLSDFETVMYDIQPDGYYAIATSEHPLTAMFMDEVIEPSLLPIKMVGVSPCFRREVGAHGLSDKGIWRVHQFTKVEQIVICKPEESWNHHEDLLQNCIDSNIDNIELHIIGDTSRETAYSKKIIE